jgi:apolipoprotein N-acyltransferase
VVKNFRLTPLLRSRYPLAIAAGLLLAASFPKLGIAGFAWVAPGLMVTAALGKRGMEVLRIGYVSGLAFYLASLYWLLLIPDSWHGIPLGPAAGWLALSAYVALFPAVWVWLAVGSKGGGWRVASGADGASSPNPAVDKWVSNFEAVVGSSWASRTIWSVSGAAIWVGLEIVRAKLFSGFPWNLLGASQSDLLPLIQISSSTGIYGVSFLVVWFSLLLLAAGVTILKRPGVRSAWIGDLALPILVVAVVFSSGLHRLRLPAAPTRATLKVTFLQPSIPQTMIWDPSKVDERFEDLLQLTEQALTNQTDLLIWPEASVPKLLYDRKTYEAVADVARKHHIWMIIGADDAEPRPNPTKENDYNYYNSAFLMGPDAKLFARYRKRNLVIFGEYIPRWLPFLKWFTPAPGDLTSGDRPVPFVLGDLGVKTSALICFEDIFPELARDCTDPETDFLVNITNDGWFGESAEQWQHADSARFRAVENGVPLLRCSNNGLTCWIDERGRYREIFQDRLGSVYGVGFMTAQIPLPAVGERQQTFYNRHGDWFGWGCVGFGAISVVWRFLRRTKPV